MLCKTVSNVLPLCHARQYQACISWHTSTILSWDRWFSMYLFWRFEHKFFLYYIVVTHNNSCVLHDNGKLSIGTTLQFARKHEQDKIESLHEQRLGRSFQVATKRTIQFSIACFLSFVSTMSNPLFKTAICNETIFCLINFWLSISISWQNIINLWQGFNLWSIPISGHDLFNFWHGFQSLMLFIITEWLSVQPKAFAGAVAIIVLGTSIAQLCSVVSITYN